MNSKKIVFIVIIVFISILIILSTFLKSKRDKKDNINVANEIKKSDKFENIEDEVQREFYKNHPDFETGFEDMQNNEIIVDGDSTSSANALKDLVEN